MDDKERCAPTCGHHLVLPSSVVAVARPCLRLTLQKEGNSVVKHIMLYESSFLMRLLHWDMAIVKKRRKCCKVAFWNIRSRVSAICMQEEPQRH